MTNAQEQEFRDFLEGVTYHGAHLTDKGKDSRVSKVKQAEEILGKDIESMVSTDARMRNALLQLQAADCHGVRSNAVRKYYEMRKGVVFPRLHTQV